MNIEPTQTALIFFDHWNANQIEDAIAMLSDDVLYDNVPFPNVVGRENVRKFHSDFGIGSRFTVEWKVVHVAAAGNVVLNERVDTFVDEAGGRITLPVMGTVTVEDGVITVWRDYFDPADFERQLALVRQ